MASNTAMQIRFGLLCVSVCCSLANVSLLQVQAPASSILTDCLRVPVDVILISHVLNPRVIANLNHMASDMHTDCGLTIWLAWAGLDFPSFREISPHVRVFNVSLAAFHEAIACPIPGMYRYEYEWPHVRHISVPLNEGLDIAQHVWVFEYDAEVPGSISKFVRRYDKSSDDFISSM
eukprot:CAMPEP_0180789152 /NCGR_PEP_ID=MMETSP1038_2-20121128/52446_1 /TAXON_ID=632150 /ORGANISM="Azadinium spinosum, Strain 3D9" /LENGTH=176 /DNA_ID=CAMNT_0022826851 /DNA_START=1 /DNA_END=529 /DNA_ORIENTATION=+